MNSVDYFGKIFPATTFLLPTGSYAHDVLPYPTRIIQDENVPADTAIFGLAKRYTLFAGTGSTGGKIEYSDHARFLDDERVYTTRLYGNGRPMDENAFVVCDISELEPMNLTVKVESNETVE